MQRDIWKLAALATGGFALSVSSILAPLAMAQPQPPIGTPSPSYPGAPPQDYGRYSPPPPEPEAPSGYDGTQPPPPPPGYVPPSDDAGIRAQDDRYAQDAERWAQENCVKAHGNPAAGAVVGGIIGAIIGSGLSGRHDRGAGTVVGAAIGAMGGAAVAGSAGSNATSPGCPPGYVVSDGAYPYAYQAQDYYYAAPPWYRPWVLIDGAWLFRPYPYHDWYYRTYRFHRGFYPSDRGRYGRHGHYGHDHHGGEHRGY